jgi:hypothetical protein
MCIGMLSFAKLLSLFAQDIWLFLNVSDNSHESKIQSYNAEDWLELAFIILLFFFQKSINVVLP